MPELSGIYDSSYIQPVAKIKENLAIWTVGKWAFYTIDFLEPIPPSPASLIDMVGIPAGARTTLGANATINKQVVAALQLNDLEFVHLRWEPLDYVEGVLWEQGGQLRFNSRNIFARVDPMTRQWDPTLSTTTFWIIGLNRDMQLEVRNPQGRALAMARFQFWGYRMLLSAFDVESALKANPGPPNAPPIKTQVALAEKGDMSVIKRMGVFTFLPAEGRQS